MTTHIVAETPDIVREARIPNGPFERASPKPAKAAATYAARIKGFRRPMRSDQIPTGMRKISWEKPYERR